MIGPGLFHGLVPAASLVKSTFENNRSSSMVSMVSDSFHSLDKPAERQQLIPPQVLVPLSMKASLACSEKPDDRSTDLGIGRSNTNNDFEFVVPEGRVHGGGLMTLLGGNLKNAIM